jgi:hypothetical protein
VKATLESTPRDGDALEQSCDGAGVQRVSPATVQRIWRAHGLQPHRSETFKLSRDPEFLPELKIGES